jgi:cobalt-zinc-cadmium efflux system outer membrane protein
MKTRTIALLAVLISPLCVAQGPPQPEPLPQRLVLEEAVRLAIERNPLAAAARNAVEMAQGDAVGARLRPNPAVTLQMEDYPYFRSNPGPFFSNQEITTRFDYEIQTKRRLTLRTAAAEGAVEREEGAYSNAIRLLRLAVQSAFYRVLLAQSNLGLAQSILEQTDQVIALNRIRFEQGDISELELLRIQVERLQFADDVFQARLEVRNAKAALLALLYAPDLGADIEVVGDLSGVPELGAPIETQPAELYQLASAARPDLRAAQAEMQRAAAQNRFQRAISSPNITVGGGYKRSGPYNSLVFGVTIPLPIFDRNQGGVLRSEAETRQAGNLAAATRNQIELEIRQAYNAFQINRERVEYIRSQQLQQAEKASQVTMAAYRLGGAPLMDYLDAQRRYRDTMRVFNQALFDERASRFGLAAAIGKGETE